jgi:hypothetical protein
MADGITIAGAHVKGIGHITRLEAQEAGEWPALPFSNNPLLGTNSGIYYSLWRAVPHHGPPTRLHPLKVLLLLNIAKWEPNFQYTNPWGTNHIKPYIATHFF